MHHRDILRRVPRHGAVDIAPIWVFENAHTELEVEHTAESLINPGLGHVRLECPHLPWISAAHDVRAGRCRLDPIARGQPIGADDPGVIHIRTQIGNDRWIVASAVALRPKQDAAGVTGHDDAGAGLDGRVPRARVIVNGRSIINDPTFTAGTLTGPMLRGDHDRLRVYLRPAVQPDHHGADDAGHEVGILATAFL